MHSNRFVASFCVHRRIGLTLKDDTFFSTAHQRTFAYRGTGPPRNRVKKEDKFRDGKRENSGKTEGKEVFSFAVRMLRVNYYSINLRVSFLIFIVIEFSSSDM